MDEHQLISSVLNGNKEAFRFLYKLHKDAAWRLAVYICKEEELAKDAVQVAFLSAYKYLYAFRKESSFKTWLLRIVKNESVHLCKLEHRYADLDEATALEQEPIYISIDAQLNKKEQKAWIEAILGQLKDKESVVLKLFYLEELTIKEVAAILEMKENNVKVVLHRARKSFRTIAEQ